MHDGRTTVADDLKIMAGTINQARTGHHGAVRQETALRQITQALQPLGRTHAVLLQHQVVFDLGLAAMLAQRNVKVATRRSRAAQQLGCAGLNPVGGQHGANQPACSAFDPVSKSDGRVQFSQAAWLIVQGANHTLG